MHLQNLYARAQKQMAAHAVNTALVVVGITVFFWLRGSFSRPIWLNTFAPHISALLVAIVLGEIYFNFRQGALLLCSDWLAVAPIPQAQRSAYLRAKVALRSAISLSGYTAFAALLLGARYAALVLVFASGLSVLLLLLVPKLPTDLVRQLVNVEVKHGVKAGHVRLTPFSAWFHSAVPPIAQLTWWWLVPLLALPMGSNLMIIVRVTLGFLLLLRFAAVCQALSSAMHQITQLTNATPLQPSFLYRAAVLFSLHAAAALGLLCISLTGFSARMAVVSATFLLGLMVLGTALHFSFGFRNSVSGSFARAQAALVIATIFALCAASAPPLSLLVCAVLWPWLYRRGVKP